MTYSEVGPVAMGNLKVAVRADASKYIASGHVVRCLTLAAKLRAAGCEVVFVCRSGAADMADVVDSAGFQVLRLPGLGNGEDAFRESHEVGHADWTLDASQTLEVLSGSRWDWLVVDHYALDARWESRVGAVAGRVMAIDDTADRVHACHLLLDQNLHVEPERRYDGLIPSACGTLFGPGYALLRDEFALCRARLRQRSGRIARVLISYGGVDATNETEKALDALKPLVRQGVAVDVLIGSNHAHPDRIRARCAGDQGPRLVENAGNVAEMMSAADLALGGGGTMTWERCCLKLPAVVTAVAENQVAIATEVARAGAAMYAGRASSLSAPALSTAVEQLADDVQKVRDMGETAGDLVDGLGAARVVDAMTALGRLR